MIKLTSDSDKAVALMNVPSLIGAIIGCLYAGPLSDMWCLYCARKRKGLREAEDRLWFFILPGVLSPLGMLLFGIGSDRGWYWPGPYIGLGLIGFGWGSCGDLAISYLIDAYPDIVLESLVGVAVINNLIGMVGAFVTGSWIDSAGVSGSYIAIAVLEVIIIVSTQIRTSLTLDRHHCVHVGLRQAATPSFCVALQHISATQKWSVKLDDHTENRLDVLRSMEMR